VNTLLQEAAISQTYSDVEMLINKIVWRFYRSYGGSFDDWKAEANLFFMKAYHKHDEEKGAFTTWVYHYVTRGLQKYLKKNHTNIKPISIGNDDEGCDILAEFPNLTNPFYTAIDLFDEVRADSKLVLKLVWDMPEDLLLIETKSGSSSKHVKITIKKYLLKLGWTHARVKESFKEIGEALHG
jgi:hypothetical protein